MTRWEHPPVSKIYEALGAVADGRVAVTGTTAKVTSSSGNKTYDVSYDPASRAIASNDNGSHFQGYLGYPSIAFLMMLGEIRYDPDIAAMLAGVAWKDINTRFKNDFDAAVEYVMSEKAGAQRAAIEGEVARIAAYLREHPYDKLASKAEPPKGY